MLTLENILNMQA